MKKNLLGKSIFIVVAISFVALYLYRFTVNKDQEAIESYNTAVEVENVQLGSIEKQNQKLDNILIINKNALIRELEGNYVFLIDGNIASKVPVSLGVEDDEKIEIISGIEKDDLVVVKGNQFIKNGEEVNVVGGNS